MDISIVGAAGAMGRAITSQIIQDRLLERQEILQLVVSQQSSNPWTIHGIRADLQDAYAGTVPEIDVTSDPTAIIGDIVVIAAGITFPTDPSKIGSLSRDVLAKANAPVFDTLARNIAANRKGNPPIVIIVSNPVELAVHLFAKHLPRENVIGMGAYSDSLRFRWEIARDLGIRRQRVQGYVFGEHGADMVPLWSTVKVMGMDDAEWRAAEKFLRRGLRTEDFPERLATEREKISKLILDHPKDGIYRALEAVNALPPDIRVVLKSVVIHFTGSRTPAATSAVTVELVRSVIENRAVEVAGQFQHAGEFGFHGPFGTRLIVEGLSARLSPVAGLRREEDELMKRAFLRIQEKIEGWTRDVC